MCTRSFTGLTYHVPGIHTQRNQRSVYVLRYILITPIRLLTAWTSTFPGILITVGDVFLQKTKPHYICIHIYRYISVMLVFYACSNQSTYDVCCTFPVNVCST